MSKDKEYFLFGVVYFLVAGQSSDSTVGTIGAHICFSIGLFYIAAFLRASYRPE